MSSNRRQLSKKKQSISKIHPTKKNASYLKIAIKLNKKNASMNNHSIERA
jgi:hypothetical protein